MTYLRTLTLTTLIAGFSMISSMAHSSSEFGCMLKPIKKVDVRSPVVGRLSSISVSRGSYVRKGDIIAKLDSSVEQAAVNSARYRSTTKAQIISAQNKIKSARKKVDRMKQLYEANFMSAQALDDAYSELNIVQGELDLAIENQMQAEYEYRTALSELNRRVITSPISGIVTTRYLDSGAIVGPSEGKHPIISIAQTNRLKVQIIAPVKYYHKYTKNTSITIVPEAPFNRPVRAKISIKDSSVDAASGTFSMIAYLDNTGNRIPSGILCEVKSSV